MSDDFKGLGKAAARVVIAAVVVLILCAAGFLGYLLGGGEWSAIGLRPQPAPQTPPRAPETDVPDPSVPQEPVAPDLDGEVPLDDAIPEPLDPSEPAPEPVDPGEPAERLPPDDSRETSPAPPRADELQPAEPSVETVISPADPALVESAAAEPAAEQPEAAAEPAVEPVEEAPEVVGDLLASLTPLEVRGVDLGEQALVRNVALAERERQVIWALPLDDSHASHISFFLEEGYRRLRGAAIILPPGAEPGGDTVEAPAAVFRIYGDSNLLWESDPVRGRDASHPFDVNIRDVEMLVLVVENLTPESEAGFAWADLELLGEPAS